MTDDPLTGLESLSFMESRIPAIDALATFVPEGQKPTTKVKRVLERIGFSRWFPVEGGHKVLVPYEGGDFDELTFTLEKAAWDHETCKGCRKHIPAMTLCWVTADGPYIILCEDCKKQLDAR